MSQVMSENARKELRLSIRISALEEDILWRAAQVRQDYRLQFPFADGGRMGVRRALWNDDRVQLW